MTTLTEKETANLEYMMALLAKAAYFRVKPTSGNPNPEQVNN